MDSQVIERYRKIRREADVPAKYALLWAKNDVRAEYPGVEWDWDSHTSMLGEGMVGRYRIEIRATIEDDPMLMGEFTDNWRPSAYQNPEWRGDISSNDVLRWYLPMTSVETHRAELRRVMGRHEAYMLATRYVRQELAADREPEQYIISVSVFPGDDDVETGSASVGGFDVPDTNAEEYLIERAGDLIAEALAEAERNDKAEHTDD